MSLIDLLYPGAILWVGIEDDDDGSLRLYLDARWKNLHTHVDDPEAIKDLRSAWNGGAMGHQALRVPREAWCTCPPPRRTEGGPDFGGVA